MASISAKTACAAKGEEEKLINQANGGCGESGSLEGGMASWRQRGEITTAIMKKRGISSGVKHGGVAAAQRRLAAAAK
jgi:hypothetical protein